MLFLLSCFSYLTLISSLNINTLDVTSSSSTSTTTTSSSSINLKLLLVLIVGGILWFVLVLYTIKKLLLSSNYFKCMSPLFDVLDKIILYIINCGNNTEQHFNNTINIQNEILTYQALPPKLSNIIAFLVITTLTGIWVCTILAALSIENWSSFIGIWMLVVCMFYFGLWLYFKKQTIAENINNTEIKEVDYIKADILADIESTKVAMSEIPVELRDEKKSKKLVHQEDEETPSVL